MTGSPRARKPAAERMRRLRERRHAGLRVLPIEVSLDELVERLVARGDLAPDDADNVDEIGRAVAEIVERDVGL